MRRTALAAIGALGIALACASRLTPLAPRPSDGAAARPERPSPPPAMPVSGPPPLDLPAPQPDVFVPVRVALATAAQQAILDATGPWQVRGDRGDVILRAQTGDEWMAAPDGPRIRLRNATGRTVIAQGPIVVTPADDSGMVRFARRRYRGELRLAPHDSGLLVVNRLDVEEYLRGVVPLEIGNRPVAEVNATAAQAVTARSYTYIRVRSRRGAAYDLIAGVLQQVYGGADAERAGTDSGVAATAGLALMYAGELVDAPFHSTCGGSTAAATEVWQSGGDRPYLQPVNDRVPGTSDRYWCDGSATFRWTRTLERDDLNAAVGRYLREYVRGAPASPGRVRDLIPGPRTQSGRLASLAVVTDRGRYELRGNAMRFVLRGANGQILNSTYFSLAATRDAGGLVERVVFRGNGNGHGIGMCQWGAIGRARAGHSARQILAAYYPGTTVARIDQTNLRRAR